MKTKFSTAWKECKSPKRQRKYVYNAPLHIKGKFLSCNLSKSLREEYIRRCVRVRVHDTVKVMRGEHKGKTGEVTKVIIKDSTLHVKGVTRKKVNGQEVNLPLKPSNVQIIELDLKDEKRAKKLREKRDNKKEIAKQQVKESKKENTDIVDKKD